MKLGKTWVTSLRQGKSAYLKAEQQHRRAHQKKGHKELMLQTRLTLQRFCMMIYRPLPMLGLQKKKRFLPYSTLK